MMFPLSPRMPVRWLQNGILLLSVGALTACGGGSGGDSGPPANSSSSSISSVSSSSSSSSSEASSSSSSSVADTTPDSFSFAAVSDADPGAVYLSDTVVVSGIDVPVAVSIEGGEYSLSDGSGAFTTEAGEISAGQQLTLRAAAPGEGSTSKTVTVTVGGFSTAFVLQTKDDTSADGFSFVAKEDAEPGSEHTSNTVTITGISVPVPVNVSGGLYSINGGTFTSEAGEISAGQTLTLRGTASEEINTGHNVQVTVGEGDTQQVATFAITTLDDITAPEAAITFPPPMSATDDTTLLIRGTAEDDYSDITSVSVLVNGDALTEVEATSDDGFANWTANVTLSEDAVHSITVVATDSEGNETVAENAAEVTVHQQAFELAFPDNAVPIDYAQAMTFDAVGNRTLISNSHTLAGGGHVEQIIVVDMETGQRSIFLDEGGARDDYPGDAVIGMAIDTARDRILASSIESSSFSADAIYTIDLETGHQQVLSSSTVPNNEQPELDNPAGIALDPANPDVAYVVAENSGSLSRLDLVTGERTLISDNSMPDSGTAFNSPQGLVIDGENNRALVADIYGQAVLAVDLTTGVRTELHPPTDGNFLYPVSITTDDISSRILVNYAVEGIVSVDLSTGERTILHSRIGDVRNYLHYVPGSPYLLMADRDTQGLYALDFESQTLVTVSKSVDE